MPASLSTRHLTTHYLSYLSLNPKIRQIDYQLSNHVYSATRPSSAVAFSNHFHHYLLPSFIQYTTTSIEMASKAAPHDAWVRDCSFRFVQETGSHLIILPEILSWRAAIAYRTGSWGRPNQLSCL
jgi:hypothetical protein